MVLNYIWVGFFLIGFLVAILRMFIGVGDDSGLFSEMVLAMFDSAKTGFEISLGLTGVLTLFMGLMKVGEKAGLVEILGRWVSPFFRTLFPEIPKNHPVNGHIMMNFSANMLGLDNAATPLGLKAMSELQELNPDKENASNAQIMFLVLNTSGLTLIPISVMVYRAQLGAAQPSDIFLPILLATFFSTLAGILAVTIFQRLNILRPAFLIPLTVATLGVAGLISLLTTMSDAQVEAFSSIAGNGILLLIIASFLILGVRKKLNVYETFIEGAKEGFGIAVRIIPFLVAILVAIAVFRASGAMEIGLGIVSDVLVYFGIRTDLLPALPTAIMKPLSGSGARGLMVDTMEVYGADSFPGRLASVFQGSTDTTFYVLAVYFGSVGIRNSRHALPAGLIADFAGIIAAIIISYIFFG